MVVEGGCEADCFSTSFCGTCIDGDETGCFSAAGGVLSSAMRTIRDLRFFLLEREEEPSAYSSGAVRLAVVEFDVLAASWMTEVTDIALDGEGDDE